MMDRLKNYFMTYFEQSFVLLVLISIVLIFYFLPNKLAMLNFFYIPILGAAYYINHRGAMLGSIFCVFTVILFAWLYPSNFFVEQTPMNLGLHIVIWGGFLILTGVIVGTLRQNLLNEISQGVTLKTELKVSKKNLEKVSRDLQEHTEHMEDKIKERTHHLEKSKEAVEEMKERVEDALYSTMDPAVVKLLIEKRLRTEKRNISVLFSDLKSFTTFSEASQPEIVVTQLNRLFAEMETILLEYKAHIDKYMGDGIMAEFGAPTHYDRHALMAVMAAMKMQNWVRSSDFPLKMRIGIATGEAIVGLIGQKRQSYTALGDVVNLASRIEQRCTEGLVTIDETTYEAVNRYVAAKPLIAQQADTSDPGLSKQIEECAIRLNTNENDPELLTEMGLLLMACDHIEDAHAYISRALHIAPDNERIKIAFAESSMKMEKSQALKIKGKRRLIRLYEVTGMLDPLEDLETLPPHIPETYRRIVDSLVEFPSYAIDSVEAIDGSVGHARVVGLLSYALADMLDLPDKEKKDILLGGYFCDVGKTIVPQHILNRRESLSEKEFEEMTKHSRESARILKKIGYDNEALFDIVAAHHERYNGSGYPSGLSGENIPLGARIVAVADSYDALTSWRPYRSSWNYQAAYSEVRKMTELGAYDPRIVDCLGQLLRL